MVFAVNCEDVPVTTDASPGAMPSTVGGVNVRLAEPEPDATLFTRTVAVIATVAGFGALAGAV